MRPRTVFILFKMTFLTLKVALIQTRSSPLKFLRLMIENAPALHIARRSFQTGREQATALRSMQMILRDKS